MNFGYTVATSQLNAGYMAATWRLPQSLNHGGTESMARPKQAVAPDLTQACDLTAGAIERLTCPAGKNQAFLRDAKVPALRVRVTAARSKSFVFESKLNRETIRRTIGDVRSWGIDAARIEARRLSVMVDQGIDPREVHRQQQVARAAEKTAAAVTGLTVGEVWAVYVNERSPKWGEQHRRDIARMTQAGGVRRKRGTALLTNGPLYPLLALQLRMLSAPVIEEWAKEQAKTRATRGRLGLRLLKAFLTWCTEHPQYKEIVPAANPAKTKKAREALGKPKVKKDVLQREQLAPWFAAVQQISNPVIAACLQVMLLTGARPGEVLGLRWVDVNTRWKSIKIRDKVEGEREIPATPYTLHLLATLPRRNEWVFSSPTSKAGRLTVPNAPHTKACRSADLDGLTLHGLRRSFKSLTEWLELPVGVVAQIQGHKPSATAEKHYTVRPLDLLRVHHKKMEAWILEQAGLVFDPVPEAREHGQRRVPGAIAQE